MHRQSHRRTETQYTRARTRTHARTHNDNTHSDSTHSDSTALLFTPTAGSGVYGVRASRLRASTSSRDCALNRSRNLDISKTALSIITPVRISAVPRGLGIHVDDSLLWHVRMRCYDLLPCPSPQHSGPNTAHFGIFALPLAPLLELLLLCLCTERLGHDVVIDQTA